MNMCVHHMFIITNLSTLIIGFINWFIFSELKLVTKKLFEIKLYIPTQVNLLETNPPSYYFQLLIH
jgi:hypothetical protein